MSTGRALSKRPEGIRVTNAEIDALAIGLRRSGGLSDGEKFYSMEHKFPGQPPSHPIFNLKEPITDPLIRVDGELHLTYMMYPERSGGLFGPKYHDKMSFHRWHALGLALWVFSMGVSFSSEEEEWAAANRFADVLDDPSIAKRRAKSMQLPVASCRPKPRRRSVLKLEDFHPDVQLNAALALMSATEPEELCEAAAE